MHPQDPPDEAYGRVTNAKRFAPLHRIATELLEQLTRDFDVTRNIGYGIDPELERGFTLARPTERLAPKQAGAAPIAVAFSTFPGLHVRFGRRYTRPFPACGCDACAETADGEAERLTWMIDNVVAGRFRETVSITADGTAWYEWELWSDTIRSVQTSLLDADLARRLVAEGSASNYWQPWSQR